MGTEVPACSRRALYFQSLVPQNGYFVPVRGGIHKRHEPLKEFLAHHGSWLLGTTVLARRSPLVISKFIVGADPVTAPLTPEPRESPARFVLGALGAVAGGHAPCLPPSDWFSTSGDNV